MLNRCDASPEKEEILLKLKNLRKSKLDLDLAIQDLEKSKRLWLNHPDEDTKKRDLETLESMKKSSSELGKSIERLNTNLKSL